MLREARRAKGLSQQAVAERLGLHQRQISDLERATVDPRLSTIQNVAGALDLELMLIPRHLITTIQGLLRAGRDRAKQPMYSLGDEMPRASDDEAPLEVGGSEAGPGTVRQRSKDEEPPR
ncbi:MAG: helix-turn-helix domain-containing protein [Vicinamibacterales bacterium]